MQFDDIEWLGGRFEGYGPAARAATGILLKHHGWDWYHLTSKSDLERMLLAAIPGHEVATWGGDEAVLSISEWLDPSKAVTLGRLFQSAVVSRPGLRIRIARDIWEWDSIDGAPQVMRADLALVLPNTAIFYDWPQNRKPRRIDVDRRDGKILISSPSGPASGSVGSVLAEAIGNATFEVATSKAHILLADSMSELLAANMVANLVILIDDDPRGIVERLDELRVESAARCVVRVPRSKAREWVQAFGNFWRDRPGPIDRIVQLANLTGGIDAELVAATQTFVQHSWRFLDPRADDSPPTYYSGKRTTTALPDAQLIEPEVGGDESRAPPPSKRVLDAEVYQGKRQVQDLPPSGRLRILVSIKPKTPSSSALPDFPDELIEWKDDIRILQVHMIELDSAPVTRKMALPRRGSSDRIEFDYEVLPRKELDLRLMVCDGPQILQTARLQAKPGRKISLRFEADFTSLEKERKSFDLALMVNGSLGGRPSATVLSPEGIQISAFDTGEIGTLRDLAKDILETVITNPEISLRDTLMQLANVGSDLLEVIRDEIDVWPSDIERIQLTTKDNAFFPLEFLYDGVVPKDPNAPLCTNFRACLRSKALRERCAVRKEATVLCPMGFLGLRTVIERKVWSGEAHAPIWLKESVELAHRHQIRSVNKIAFAASDVADDFGEDDTLATPPALARIQSIIDELAPRLANWDEWEEAVGNESFSMGILIAHIEGTTIFIGADEQRNRTRLEFGTVPVAILLGCRSAIGPTASMSLPAKIMRKGHTRVVVSALTDILGRHANTAALHLGKRIRDSSSGAVAVTLGEFIVELRRELLADDIAMGLILVALGDADIALGG